MARREITVLMITHKFREVNAFADAVTVLRRGRKVGEGRFGEMSTEAMAGRSSTRTTSTSPSRASCTSLKKPVA